LPLATCDACNITVPIPEMETVEPEMVAGPEITE